MGATINNESSTTEPPPLNGQLPKPLGAGGVGGGLNAPSSEILMLLKHNNCLAGMEKQTLFVIDIQIPVCLKKRFFNSYKIRIKYLCNNCKIVYLLTFYIYNNDLPKIIYFDTY